MLTNKVESKPIIQIDIETWIPKEKDILYIDLKQFLHKELVVVETAFRTMMESFDWNLYRGKYVVVHISNGAIIPQWAFMIIAKKLADVDAVAIADGGNIREKILTHIVERRDLSEYEAKRILIKGCGNEKLSQYPYMLLTQRLSAIVRALSFGESCSMVPLFKN